MLGVVLCGGESKRMGSDKALLPMANKTWAEVAYTKLLQLQIPVYLSVNHQQVHFLKNLFSSANVVVDDITIDIGGPLLGLLSVHQIYPTEDILLFACDMPNMTTTVLQHLQTISRNRIFEVIVFNNNGQIEPLCAIYSAKALQKIMILYKQNALKKYSMHYVLAHVQVFIIDVPFSWQGYFINCNSKSDLVNL